jgi:hypothetical protein
LGDGGILWVFGCVGFGVLDVLRLALEGGELLDYGVVVVLDGRRRAQVWKASDARNRISRAMHANLYWNTMEATCSTVQQKRYN